MSEKERIQLEHNFYIIGLCIPCMAAILIALWQMLPTAIIEKFSMPCMFYTVLGIYCPGCGGTRATLYLLKGDLIKSFLYHPIVVYGAGIYLWFMISHTIQRLSRQRLRIGMHYRNLYLWFALAIVIINIAVKDIALTAFHVDLLKILEFM